MAFWNWPHAQVVIAQFLTNAGDDIARNKLLSLHEELKNLQGKKRITLETQLSEELLLAHFHIRSKHDLTDELRNIQHRMKKESCVKSLLIFPSHF